MCFDVFDVASDCEFTTEANPGTMDDDKIKAMLNGGINRISVGVQSFNDDELKKTEEYTTQRRHIIQFVI